MEVHVSGSGNPKVLAGNPCGKMPVCNEFFDCFYALELPPGSIGGYRAVGGSIPNNLNRIVDLAIKEACTHVFIVEDDSLFGTDTVMRLLKHDVPVVAGLCRRRGTPFQSYIYSGISKEGGLDWFKLRPSDRGLLGPKHGVKATGMGGILINTEVFKKLKRPYFATYYEGETEWGQDIVFGKSLIEAGIDVYCDTDVIIGHMTQCVIGSERGVSGWNVVFKIHEVNVGVPQI
jgi:hypothetical protein